ncbi:MAG: NADH:flavin oxidoreductase [Chloroflexi bacterium]|nr:NADH:flavin oxidoreductase [Chloroflexota bacterium]
MTYKRVAQLRTAADFRDYLEQIGARLDFDEVVEHGESSPLAQPYTFDGVRIGNRFTVLPMEGWDGELDGLPTDLVRRRWERFGQSGAKLIFGGEATAVRYDGRANPNQLVINEATVSELADLRDGLANAHGERHGETADLLVGLQLTHSGRFARPFDKKRLEPQILYHHPLLDAKFKVAQHQALMTDGEIETLIEDYVRAAILAQQAGFHFVDVKHCHGYLGHEFLTAFDRPGSYGGSFENRTRFLREIVLGIHRRAPGLRIGVRLSAFDWLPFRPGADGSGEPESWSGAYPYAFGGDGSGTGIDLSETNRFLTLLEELNIRLVCLTAGSPYYNPHIQRPALFPPSDGYQPPEDPLRGVARQIAVTAELKRAHPNLFMVGSGYSYLQDWLPNVAQHVVRTGMADSVGLGRMVLSYPEMPADILAGRTLQRKSICRTFSDCTTGPRNGLVSGCYPLDPFYKERPEHDQLEAIKHPDRQKEQ